jgi:hypothetical protein
MLLDASLSTPGHLAGCHVLIRRSSRCSRDRLEEWPLFSASPETLQLDRDRFRDIQFDRHGRRGSAHRVAPASPDRKTLHADPSGSESRDLMPARVPFLRPPGARMESARSMSRKTAC